MALGAAPLASSSALAEGAPLADASETGASEAVEDATAGDAAGGVSVVAAGCVGAAAGAAATVGGRIHAFGGEMLTGGQVIAGHDVYDPTADRWQSLGGTPIARHGLPSVELGGKWYVLGGGLSAGGETFRTLTNRVDVFTPSGR